MACPRTHASTHLAALRGRVARGPAFFFFGGLARELGREPGSEGVISSTWADFPVVSRSAPATWTATGSRTLGGGFLRKGDIGKPATKTSDRQTTASDRARADRVPAASWPCAGGVLTVHRLTCDADTLCAAATALIDGLENVFPACPLPPKGLQPLTSTPFCRHHARREANV